MVANSGGMRKISCPPLKKKAMVKKSHPRIEAVVKANLALKEVIE